MSIVIKNSLRSALTIGTTGTSVLLGRARSRVTRELQTWACCRTSVRWSWNSHTNESAGEPLLRLLNMLITLQTRLCRTTSPQFLLTRSSSLRQEIQLITVKRLFHRHAFILVYPQEAIHVWPQPTEDFWATRWSPYDIL